MQGICIALVVFALTARVTADVRIAETTVIKAGDRVVQGTRSTYIKAPTSITSCWATSSSRGCW